MGRPEGPGIAPADRPRGGDFSALVGRIGKDPEALDGLLYVYESLDVGDRVRLVRAVIQDVEAPLAALSVLWAVEEDRSMKQELTAWITRHGGTEPWVALRGTTESGNAHLIRPGVDGTGESLRIAWDHNEIRRIDVEPLSDSNARRADQVAIGDAADLLAPLLWRHLRAGRTVPEGVRRYADFFAASPRP